MEKHMNNAKLDYVAAAKRRPGNDGGHESGSTGQESCDLPDTTYVHLLITCQESLMCAYCLGVLCCALSQPERKPSSSRKNVFCSFCLNICPMSLTPQYWFEYHNALPREVSEVVLLPNGHVKNYARTLSFTCKVQCIQEGE